MPYHTHRQSKSERLASDVLFADGWLAKSEIVARNHKDMAAVAEVIARLAAHARQRNAFPDVQMFEAHLALINDLQTYSLALVQAEIIRAAASKEKCY